MIHGLFRFLGGERRALKNPLAGWGAGRENSGRRNRCQPYPLRSMAVIIVVVVIMVKGLCMRLDTAAAARESDCKETTFNILKSLTSQSRHTHALNWIP